MMLQPISPRLSGESATHVDISCAAPVFVISVESTTTSPTDHPHDRLIALPPCKGCFYVERRRKNRCNGIASTVQEGSPTAYGCATSIHARCDRDGIVSDEPWQR